MRLIQVCGPSTRDDGGPLYIYKNLNQIPGVKCDRMDVYQPVEKWGEFDGMVYVDWAQDCFPQLPPPQQVSPSLCWQSDTHWSPDAFTYRFNQSVDFDHIMVTQIDDVERFRRGGLVRTSWMPHASDHMVYHPPVRREPDKFILPEPGLWETCEVVPKYDIGFVGHVNTERRAEFLDAMFKEFGNFYFGMKMFFGEARQVYHSSAITLNISVNGDLNMRTFEVMGSRGFLLTDEQKGMKELGIVDGVNCATYKNTEEAIEKAHYYLSHDAERRKISEAGWRHCWQSNTYYHRGLTMTGCFKV